LASPLAAVPPLAFFFIQSRPSTILGAAAVASTFLVV
jgi:hypothetical protein